MKSNTLKFIAAMVVVAAVFSGCGLKKMVKKYDTVSYTVTPKVLETNGGKIAVKIQGSIPAKYFAKKATFTFAPVLTYANGTTKLKSITIQGEKAKGTGVTIIKKKTGGTFTYDDVITYTPDMNKSVLGVNAKATLGKKTKDLGEKKLADGVIYTSERIEKEGDLVLAPDGYVKETIITKEAEIFYAKNISELNLKLALNKDEANAAKLKALVDFLQKEWKIKNIDINGWASPEGEETNNAKLSENRSKTAETYIKDALKDIARAKAKAAKTKVDEKKLEADMPTVTLSAKGEDWDGFTKAVGGSAIKDKSKILNVVSMESEVGKKEKAINDMIVIYPELEDAILPTLRRSPITISFYEPKKTDQQMAMLATTMPDSLKKEELLYAATLTEDLATKLKIYESATKVYANDWKGYNNAGYVCLKQGKTDEAIVYLEKANTLMPNNGTIINNLGVATLWKKDYVKAKTYFETASGLGITEGFNEGPCFIKTGDYPGAISSYSGRTCTHNIALAQLCSGNSSAAATTLNCTDPKTAAVYYLLAVVGARTGSTALIYENLPKAIAADASYRDQAKDDAEFLKYNTTSDFLNAVK